MSLQKFAVKIGLPFHGISLHTVSEKQRNAMQKYAGYVPVFVGDKVQLLCTYALWNALDGEHFVLDEIIAAQRTSTFNIATTYEAQLELQSNFRECFGNGNYNLVQNWKKQHWSLSNNGTLLCKWRSCLFRKDLCLDKAPTNAINMKLRCSTKGPDKVRLLHEQD